MRYLALLFLLTVSAACGSVRDTRNEEVTSRGEGKDQWWASLPRASWARFPRVEQSQDWFEVYVVADGVFAIYEPGQFEEVISYLIVGATRALLFDTGLGIGDMHKLVAELTDRDVLVLNSHSHYDHIAGNYSFASLLGRDTAYTRSRAAGLPHEEVGEFVGPGWIWKDTPAGFVASEYRVRPFEIDGFVADGERISLGDRVIEVVFTPGHAPDAICLLDRERRILFTGDTFYPAPLYTHLEGSEFTQYAKSAHRLAQLRAQIDVLMPGHNEAGVSADYLLRMHNAFAAIEAGDAKYALTDGHREYQFMGFSIITD